MTLNELREKRSKLMFDAHSIMSGENVTSEQRVSVEKMLADAKVIASDIQIMDTLESETRSNYSAPRGQVASENRSKDEMRDATAKALRAYLTGSNSFEQRDLTVSADGVLIPTGVADPSIAKKYAGGIYDVVKKLRTSTGEPMQIPLINDTANQFVLNSGSITTTDPTISSLTASVSDYRSNPILIENSLLQDSAYDLVGFVEDATAQRYARSVNNLITVGDGTNVQALLGVTSNVTANTANVLKWEDFSGITTTIDPAYSVGAVFAMNNNTLQAVLNIKDSNGRPLFLNFTDGGNSGFAGTILGYPVKINPYLQNVATGNICVQFGNFSEGYTFREVAPGVVLKRLPERYAELNKTGFVAFARIGGVRTDAGTHPIYNIVGR